MKRGGGGHAEAREPLSKQLAKYKEYQSGLDLATGYRVSHILAAGTQGDVFLAQTVPAARTALGGKYEVAVKRVRATNAAIQNHVLREFAAVFHARTSYADEVGDKDSQGHPNIVGYLDWLAGPSGPDREVCIVMEKCEFALNDIIYMASNARMLYERKVAEFSKMQWPLGAAGQLTPKDSAKSAHLGDPMLYRFPECEIVKIMQHILSALEFLNRYRMLHRDIKPDNILWTLDSQTRGVYKLADFGTAVIMSEDSDVRKEDVGTLWTMAPEILGRREHSWNCDVWSLGCVAFEVATLDKPFNSKELLAFKNSDEARETGSFWPALLGPVSSPRSPPDISKSSSSGQALRRAASVALAISRKSTTPCSSASKQKSHHAEQPRGLLCHGKHSKVGHSSAPRLSSVAGVNDSTPTNRSRARPKELELVHEAHPHSSNGSSSSSGAMPTSPVGDGLETPVASTPGTCISSPTGPMPPLITTPSASSTQRTRRNVFLRKRCNGRWGYCDELKVVIFEEMLEEDLPKRPSPVQLLRSARFCRLLEVHELVEAPAVQPTSPASADVSPSSPGAGDVASPSALASSEQSPVMAPEAAFNPASALKVVTPEAYLAAVRQERQKAEETRAADTRACGG